MCVGLSSSIYDAAGTANSINVCNVYRTGITCRERTQPIGEVQCIIQVRARFWSALVSRSVTAGALRAPVCISQQQPWLTSQIAGKARMKPMLTSLT